ncbi:neurofilament medium polypeptide-like [Homarus americanus]|uniref:neurofilament medium polypeptide-like n=1 Tax=Homarus americanus TaxID=6706 RepID=UPI001C46C2AE|nr:neurofilament medium polypeptide-like [Homarus americanus]
MMTGILERVFPLESSLSVMDHHCLSHFSPVPTTCIIGPPHSMKSAILMQAAVTETVEGGCVLYVTPNEFSCPPPSVHGMYQSSPDLMNEINFLYTSETSRLERCLANLHFLPEIERPTFIIIDDLQFYTAPQDIGDTTTQKVNAARVISLAQEYAEFYTNTRTRDTHSDAEIDLFHQCSVLVSWTKRTSDAMKLNEVEIFAKDFCHHVWTVHVDKAHKSNMKGYDLVSEWTEQTCTISFSASHPSAAEPYILLHEVYLETDEMEEETTQAKVMEGEATQERVMEGEAAQENVMEGETAQEHAMEGEAAQENVMEGEAAQENVMEGEAAQTNVMEEEAIQENVMEGAGLSLGGCGARGNSATAGPQNGKVTVAMVEYSRQIRFTSQQVMCPRSPGLVLGPPHVRSPRWTPLFAPRKGRAREGEAAQENVMNGEAAQEKVMEGEAAQEKVMEGEAIQEKVMEGEAIQENVMEGEAIQENVIEGEAIQENIMEGEAVQKKVMEGEAVQEKVMEGEAIQEKVMEGEAIQEKVMEGEAIQEKVMEGEAIQEKVMEGEAAHERDLLEGKTAQESAMEGKATQSEDCSKTNTEDPPQGTSH